MALELSLPSALGMGTGPGLDGCNRVGEGNQDLKAAQVCMGSALLACCPAVGGPEVRDKSLQCEAQAALTSL